MTGIPSWRRHARLFGPDPQSDVDDELRFHLDSKIDDLVAQGWTLEDARREAAQQLGDLRRLRDLGTRLGHGREQRRRRGASWDDFLRDVGYTVRTLRRDKGFAVVTVLILGVAIAANTAVFSVIDTLWLRALPFAASGELTWLQSGRDVSRQLRKTAGLSQVTYTVGVFEALQRHSQSFHSLTSYNPFFGNSEYTLTGGEEPQRVAGVMVAQNFFQTLGVQPILGRLFVAADARGRAQPAVLLAHAFWQRHFASDPAIVGRAIALNKQPATVIGVLPASFDFGSIFSPGLRFDVFVPAMLDDMQSWGNTLAIVGRRKPGISVAQAQAEIDVVIPRLMAAHKEWRGDYSSTVVGLKDFVSGKLRRSLLVLWGAVGLVLLIACVNLSNLLLSRAAARRTEFAVRAAVGAGRARVFRQLLTESLVLNAAGAILGLTLASAMTAWLARQGDAIAIPLLGSVSVDRVAFAWTVLLMLATVLLFSLVPGLRLAAGTVQEALKDSGRGTSGGRWQERLRSSMVVSEVALACVLLISAGLLVRSFLNVLNVDIGFEPSRAAVISVDYDDGGSAERRRVLLQDMLRSVTAIPGIESAGIADMLPLGRNRSWGLKANDRTYPNDDGVAALTRVVTPGYLDAMGMRLTAGRDFSWLDADSGQAVVIVNETAARRHWPGQDPVGRLASTTGNGGWRDSLVIGVVADVRQHTVEESLDPEMFLPTWQAEPAGAELVIRTSLLPETLVASVRTTLRAVNPSQPAADLRPLQRIVDRSVSPRRFFMLLVTSFAVVGLFLASLGIFGVISYSVTQRTREIGIRMALGSTASRVQLAVIGASLRLALTGVVLGTVASLGAGQWIASMLFGTNWIDPVTILGVILVVGLAAFVGGYVPARRASQIEPITALRGQ
jgi:predicted permease